jgi:hypothetical protein
LKDESYLKIEGINMQGNHLDLAAYGKKGMFQAAELDILQNDLLKINYLVEPSVVLIKKNKIYKTIDIKNYMYGKKYGKASIK